MYISVATIRAIVDRLNRCGVSTGRFCYESGFDAARLADATVMVPIHEYPTLVSTALALSSDPALGLHVAEQAPVGALHTVGYVLVNCRTIRDAIAQMIRLSPLIFEAAHWQLRERDREAYLCYDHGVIDASIAQFDAEFSLVSAVRVGRQFTGRNNSPLRMDFTYPAPAHVAEYERVFACPLNFGQAQNRIVFNRAALDRPQLHCDESVVVLLKRRADFLLADRQSDTQFKRRVVDLIKYQAKPDEVNARALAKQLGLSPRTLRRRLRALNISLSALVEEARCDRARSALDSTTPIKVIAERLGYSEPSAFHRAFKRWTGMTPLEYRADRLGGVAEGSGPPPPD